MINLTIIEEEIKLNVEKDQTIKDLKKVIYSRKDILDQSSMCLMYAGVKLDDSFSLEKYSIKSGSTIVQSKQDLSEVPGLLISFEPDMLSFDDSNEARAKMPCGHVISTESMTLFLRSLVDAKKYIIKCPG